MQVGQVIQVYPHQVALMGMIPALVVGITTQILNWYTVWLLVILFLERKRIMVSSCAHSNPDFLTAMVLLPVRLGQWKRTKLLTLPKYKYE